MGKFGGQPNGIHTVDGLPAARAAGQLAAERLTIAVRSYRNVDVTIA